MEAGKLISLGTFKSMTDGQPERQGGDDSLSEEEAMLKLRRLLGEEPGLGSEELDDEARAESELEAISQQVSEVVREGSQEADRVDGEFNERMANFEAKTEAARAKRTAKATEQRIVRKSDAEAAQGLGVGLSIAYTIIGLPLLGALIGFFFDQRLGTQLWKGVGLLIAAVIALVFSILILRRANSGK